MWARRTLTAQPEHQYELMIRFENPQMALKLEQSSRVVASLSAR